MDLDKTDKKILKILQQNGRIRNLDLADTIGLSNTPCAKRVKRLEDTGVISGYQAIVNPDAAGKYVSAFVLMQIGSNTREAANRFAEEIKGILAVTECYMTTGSLDYIARIHANSLSDYEAVIKDELGKIKDIVKLETLIILNNIVSTRGISI
ncbi:MAG: Lrp/AsnC family transcriptional regulator [Arenicella sp.]|nr:Lrp/AsnC family transcriptional regulator [Arenicella sp.]